MHPTEPQWRPGHELSFWPELKVARAQQHLSDLNMKLHVWSKSTTVNTRKVISDDGHRVDVIVDVPAPPPLAEMALALGDAIHNLRSALDAAVWELANLDQSSLPTNPKQVTFPVCLTERAWTIKVRDALETVPAIALERLRSVQPFMYENGSQSAIVMLHNADIRDKHKTALSCSFETRGISTELATFKFIDENEIPDPPFTLDIKETGALSDGEILLSVHSSGRFAAVSFPINIQFDLTMETDQGRVGLQPVVDTLMHQVRSTLDILYYGIEGANEMYRQMEADVEQHQDLNSQMKPPAVELPSVEEVVWDAVAPSEPLGAE